MGEDISIRGVKGRECPFEVAFGIAVDVFVVVDVVVVVSAWSEFRVGGRGARG